MAPVKIISILWFAFSSLHANAVTTDTLVVIFDRLNFVQGDSIEMEAYTEPFKNNQPAQTAACRKLLPAYLMQWLLPAMKTMQITELKLFLQAPL